MHDDIGAGTSGTAGAAPMDTCVAMTGVVASYNEAVASSGATGTAFTTVCFTGHAWVGLAY